MMVSLLLLLCLVVSTTRTTLLELYDVNSADDILQQLAGLEEQYDDVRLAEQDEDKHEKLMVNEEISGKLEDSEGQKRNGTEGNSEQQPTAEPVKCKFFISFLNRLPIKERYMSNVGTFRIINY